MTTNPPAALPLRDRLVRRLRRWSVSAADSAWTPVIIAAAVLVIVASGFAIQRLAFQSPGAGQTDGEPIGSSGDALGAAAVDYTLAPEAVRPISMDEARLWNAKIPFSSLPVLAARPFIMPPDNLAGYARALDCMTAAIYYEAASETASGQAAVAQVVLNRMRHPAFPKTVCGVVFQGQERSTGCQFSFTCDGALTRPPSPGGWAKARAAAASALNGSVSAEVGMSTHYHTDWVAPYWAERLVKVRQIGTHIFYRWTGAWGLPPAFRGVHAGDEPVIAKLEALATYIEVPEPELVDMPEIELSQAAVPEIVVAVPPEPVVVASIPVPPPPPVAEAAAVPPPPSVLANPLAPATGVVPQRRTRIATPR